MLRRLYQHNIGHSELSGANQTSVIPNAVRNPPCKIMPLSCSGQNVALARSRHRGCFASLCMTTQRRKCFAARSHPSIRHSERSEESPVQDHAHRMLRHTLASARSRPRGCFASLCMTTQRRKCFAARSHPSIRHSERSEESPVQDHAPIVQRAKRRPSAITPQGMLRFALHDSVAEEVLRRSLPP